MDHYHNPRNAGTLEDPDIAFSDENPLCGDTITVNLQHNSKGRVTAARHFSEGCAISQAAASMLFEKLEGMKMTEILAMNKEEVLEEFGTELSISRVKCALLALTAVKKALVQHSKDMGEDYA